MVIHIDHPINPKKDTIRFTRRIMIKKLLAKYGRHFWIVSLSVTVYASYDFAYNEGDFFSILMLAVLTYVFFIERNGKLEEENHD